MVLTPWICKTKSLMALQAVSLPADFESAIKETQAQTGR